MTDYRNLVPLPWENMPIQPADYRPLTIEERKRLEDMWAIFIIPSVKPGEDHD